MIILQAIRFSLVKALCWLLSMGSCTEQPFVGAAKCHACSHDWDVFAPNGGVHPKIIMVCPACDLPEGRLVP